MTHFAGEVTLRVLEDARGRPVPTDDGRAQWVAVDPPLVYVQDDGFTITNPSGEPTDLGSIPQAAWSFGFSPEGVGVQGFIIHDLLYRTKGTCQVGGKVYRTRSAPYTRAEADAILRDCLKLSGVGVVRRNLIYAAVRVGGVNAWGT